MKDILRYLVTAGVWGGLMVPLSIMASIDNPNVGHAFIAFFAFAMAVVITFFMWDGSKIILASLGYYEHEGEGESKRKHTDQNVDAALLLVQLLSDDERQTMRQRLMRRNDGELPQILANEADTEYSERY